MKYELCTIRELFEMYAVNDRAKSERASERMENIEHEFWTRTTKAFNALRGANEEEVKRIYRRFMEG